MSFRSLSISIVLAASVISLTALSAGANHRHGDPPSCTAASVPLGATLTISGSGYQPGATYGLAIVWPNNNGTGGTSVTADSSGTWSKSTWAYFSGSYTFDVTAIGGNHALLATCSTTVS